MHCARKAQVQILIRIIIINSILYLNSLVIFHPCCWLLAAGCWLLAAGCWLLAVHWLQTLGPHDSQPGLEVLRSG